MLQPQEASNPIDKHNNITFDKFATSPVVSRLMKMEKEINNICISYEMGYPTV
jgi:hypothetical protein